mmetsp:Transcript_26512/g.62312  ORF Transcript_26512/g.62312 Transcript_26512/m.62312 type:complete len:81 (-) Transcript_26512:441-683(-)
MRGKVNMRLDSQDSVFRGATTNVITGYENRRDDGGEMLLHEIYFLMKCNRLGPHTYYVLSNPNFAITLQLLRMTVLSLTL